MRESKGGRSDDGFVTKIQHWQDLVGEVVTKPRLPHFGRSTALSQYEA
jgi:hypothetical protein